MKTTIGSQDLTIYGDVLKHFGYNDPKNNYHVETASIDIEWKLDIDSHKTYQAEIRLYPESVKGTIEIAIWDDNELMFDIQDLINTGFTVINMTEVNEHQELTVNTIEIDFNKKVIELY